MTSEPNAPGAPAIYLYRQVDRDDENSRQVVYARIKVFNDEGRKYADVEIPFIKGREDVRKIQARTIHPDGSITNFDGKIYEKTIVKAKGFSYLAKTFTLPDVQPGSIIEYRYQEDLESGYVFDSHWILSEELFTRQAKFTLKAYSRFAMRCIWPIGLPPGTPTPTLKDNTVRLEARNIPAFLVEDYMPPENAMKYRIDFVYFPGDNPEKEYDKFWKKEGSNRYSGVSDFIDKKKAMEAAVAQITSPADAPEVKLRKIYSRVQQLHNTSFDREKTEEELKREKTKTAKNVEDIWKSGTGNGYDLDWLFLALVRAANVKADPVLVSTRDRYFFDARNMNPFEINSNVVLVNLNGKDLFLDPGNLFTPFGMLPWSETSVPGLRLDKEGGAWLRTPLPDAFESRIERKADLRFSPETGGLEGKVTVTYTGLEAQRRRSDERNEDDTERKKDLETELRESIPIVTEAELTNHPTWTGSETPLVAEFDIKTPGWATAAGRRVLLAVGLFSNEEKHLFEHENRVHPIYFSFPHQVVDDVSITFPAGWQLNSLPPSVAYDAKAAVYNMTAENRNGALQMHRQLTLNLYLVDNKFYGALRTFFQNVRAGDEQQVVVLPGGRPAKN